MADIQSTQAGTRVAIDRTGVSRGGGSVGLVLLIAVVLVGAAVALMFIGRANAQPYILALLAVLAHGRRVPHVRACRRHPAALRHVTAAARSSRRWSMPHPTASW